MAAEALSSVEVRSVAALEEAMARARGALTAQQRRDGSWNCDTDIGPGGLAIQLLTESLFGALPAQDAQAACLAFAPQQRPDGSFPPHPHAAEGSVATTALVWAALHACGAGPDEPMARAALAYVSARGGLAAVGRAFRERSDTAALFLLATGHLDAGFLPRLPPGTVLAPLELVLDRRVHAGNVMTMLMLASLAGRYGSAAPGGLLGAARRAVEGARVRELLCAWQNADGSWNGSPLQTCLMLLGLHAVGLTRADAPVKRALTWLEQMKRRGPGGLAACAMDNDVWSTALCALALHASGEPVDGEVLARAQAYLLDCQARTPMPRANQRKPGAVRTGGWPFQRGNETMPDTDDTGVVLAALGRLAGRSAPREVFRALDAGAAWLRDMQNPDGGFPTFVWGLPGKAPGPLFLKDLRMSLDEPRALLASLLRPPPEYGDPSVEGVTGRVLWGLGACGVGRDEPVVCRAIDFLRAQQCESGAWWGRWKVCFLAETATVLLGLAAVGEDMSAGYVQRAVRWVCGCQNADGGFGELPEAYRDPSLAGRGPSMAPVTAYVVLGLLATGRAPPGVVERAVGLLLEQQRADGLWDNGGWLHTFIPPDLLYVYDMPARALPLLALAEHRRCLRA